MSSSSVLSLCKGGGRLWLYCLKKASWLFIIHVMVSCISLSLSQMDDMDFFEVENGTNINNTIVCPNNTSCESLPGSCLECDFDETCRYGDVTEVTCTPSDSVENCTGPRNFTKDFTCQYCYQLPVDEVCCDANSTCDIRSTSDPFYIANCSAREDILCLPPRNFSKKLRCNYSTGRRWSTAFLLSFTLGGFGIDRFYLNYWGAACGKMLTFGGLGVWSILDVILVGTGYLGPADGSAYVY